MSFFSWEFLAFTAGALLLYYLLPKKLQWLVLLALSLGFYCCSGWRGLIWLLFTAGTTWAAGLLLERLNARAKADKSLAVKGKKRLVLTICLLLDFGLLYAMKYWNFTAETLAKAGVSLPMSSLVMPLGLSFYMFQSVGYAVDCYRGKYPAQRNPLKYLLFVSFFPQMVQGPISRCNELEPQLTAEHPFSADRVKYGIQLAMWGYIKKLIIADRAAVVVQTVFGSLERYGGFFYAFAVLFYCVQLYCDFSGGIDVTRGVAQMFGVDLAENFRRPIFAASLADYWRRWHITLGTWMRDYVFYPLAFSKPLSALSRWTRKRFGGKLGKVIPTACATFVAGFHAFQLLRTMVLVFVGRYITRAPRLLSAFAMLKKTLLHPCLYQVKGESFLKLGLSWVDYGVVVLGVLVMLLLEKRQEKGVKIRKSLEEKSAFLQWLWLFLPLAALFAHLVFSSGAVDVNLIYQQF